MDLFTQADNIAVQDISQGVGSPAHYCKQYSQFHQPQLQLPPQLQHQIQQLQQHPPQHPPQHPQQHPQLDSQGPLTHGAVQGVPTHGYSQYGGASYRSNSLSLGLGSAVRFNSLTSTDSDMSEMDLLPDLWRPESNELAITAPSLLPPLFKTNDIWNPEPRNLLPNDLIELAPNAYDDNEILNFERHNDLKSASPEKQRKHKAASMSGPSVEGEVKHSEAHSKSHGKHKQNLNTNLYKTELCASFTKLNMCPYGNKCQFAHGESELKVVERPPKWRSKPCANWTKYGNCRYGSRCCFKHAT